MSDVDARIAAAKEKLAALDKARSDAAEARKKDEEADSLERELDLAQELVKAEADIGPLGRKLLVVEATRPDGFVIGSVILKAAAASAYSTHKNTIEKMKGAEIDNAIKKLWLPCVVYPAIPIVEEMVKELPVFNDLLGSAVIRLCGFRAEDLSGK